MGCLKIKKQNDVGDYGLLFFFYSYSNVEFLDIYTVEAGATALVDKKKSTGVQKENKQKTSASVV